MEKKLPEINSQSGNLFKLPYEALTWELLKTAIELDIFDFTKEFIGSQEISDKLSLNMKNTEYMLNALVALGCLSKKNGKFKNTEDSEQFFTNGKETSLAKTLLFMEKWTQPVLNGGLKNLIINGPPEKKNIANPDIWEKSARININYLRCGRAQAISRYVSELPEFPKFSKILDLGAGPGIIGIAVASAHPSLKCVVFDQPSVSKVAEEVIKEYGAENRISVMSGDYMNDDIGRNYDFIMANFTLNFYRDRLGEIINKIYKALNNEGIFMVTSDGISKDKTSPAESIISWLPTMIQGNDMSFESGQIAAVMREIGFVSTEQKTISDIELEAHGPVEMTIGRKE